MLLARLHKLTSPLTDLAQEHSFNAFSRLLKGRPVGAGLIWPGICIAKRLGSTEDGGAAE